MGCFNFTCGYSKIDIREGDEVKVFFIVDSGRKEFNGCMCYSHDVFKVLAPGITATYNDYGWFEFDEQDPIVQLNQRIISNIATNKVEVQYPRREYEAFQKNHTDGELVDWDTIGNLIHAGQLFGTKRYGKGHLNITMMAVHKPLYDEIASTTICRGWGQNKKPIVDSIIEEFNATRENDISKEAMKAKVDAILQGRDYNDITKEERSEIFRLEDFRWRDCDHLRYDLFENGHWYKDWSLAYEERGERESGYLIEDTQLLAEEVTKLISFDAVMDAEHVMWQPHMTAGQSYDYDQFIDRHKRLTAFTEQKRAERDEEYDDE